MLLYHGTSEKNAAKIMEHGILCRNDSGKDKNSYQQSMDKAVYLTSAYAPFYANKAATMHERWALIEIDTDRLEAHDLFLVPDENFLEQMMLDNVPDSEFFEDFNALETKSDRLKWLGKEIHNFCSLWKSSLDGIGNCAVLGSIPVSCITRVVTMDPAQHALMSCLSIDPIIDISSFAVVGQKYTSLTKWFAVYEIRTTDLDHGYPVLKFRIWEDEKEEYIRNLTVDEDLIAEAISNRRGFKIYNESQ